jgi:hypothetical protein
LRPIDSTAVQGAVSSTHALIDDDEPVVERTIPGVPIHPAPRVHAGVRCVGAAGWTQGVRAALSEMGMPREKRSYGSRGVDACRRERAGDARTKAQLLGAPAGDWRSVCLPGGHARLCRRHHHLLALPPTRGGGPPAAWARSETSNPPAARRAPRHQYPIRRHRATPAVRLGLALPTTKVVEERGRGRCADAARSTTATPRSSTGNDARRE